MASPVHVPLNLTILLASVFCGASKGQRSKEATACTRMCALSAVAVANYQLAILPWLPTRGSNRGGGAWLRTRERGRAWGKDQASGAGQAHVCVFVQCHICKNKNCFLAFCVTLQYVLCCSWLCPFTGATTALTCKIVVAPSLSLLPTMVLCVPGLPSTVAAVTGCSP